MKAFGVDPGTSHSGAALVDLSGPRPYLLEYGWLPNADVRDWIAEVTCDVIGIETPDEVHGRGDMTKAAIFGLGTNLTKLGKIATDMARDAEARVIPTYRFTARQWRRQVPRCKGGVGDKAVASWLRVYLDGLPKRTKNHERDAMGTALHAANLLRQNRMVAVGQRNAAAETLLAACGWAVRT